MVRGDRDGLREDDPDDVRQPLQPVDDVFVFAKQASDLCSSDW